MRKDILSFILLLVLLLILNWLATGWFFRLDLTSEKRYTLSSNSKEFLKKLDKDLAVTVYLDGDLNPGFKKLARSTREMLDEFRIHAGDRLIYSFVDPNEGSMSEKKALYERLQHLGCEPVPVFESGEDGRKSRSMVFPYALVAVGDKVSTVNLLDNISGYSGAENLNKSAEGLEYKLMEAFRKMSIAEKPRIAFLEGHGELDEIDVVDVTGALSEFYQVERGQIADNAAILDPYKVVIVAKPQSLFSEKEKFVLDQYAMNGGRILWMVDAVTITLDSLTRATNTVGLMNDFNIGDQLFKYGIRINPNLLEDVQAAQIPINVSPAGQAPKFVPVPWLFSPLLQPNDVHPVSRNINLVKGEFVSSIDTVGEGLKLGRHVLLTTSRFTKVNPVPVFVSLAMVNEQPRQAEFNKQFIPVAYAQEGIFPSVFENRPTPVGLTQVKKRLAESVPTRMVFVADGDLAKNQVRQRFTNPQIIPLGYDELSGQTFGNKDFMLNAVNYLADDEGWMALRARNYTLRLLDKEKLGADVWLWKVLNVAVPVALVVVTGVVFVWLRRKTYASRKD
ncbi:MAG: gliding motility-associated ABC transporter substrate-binding protein GldG [Breznakibacter sp.]